MIIVIAVGEPSGGLPTLARAAELAVASQAAVVVLSQRVVRLALMPVLVVPAGSPEREHKSFRCQSRPGERHPSAAQPHRSGEG